MKRAIVFFISLPFFFVFSELFRKDLVNFDTQNLILFLSFYIFPLISSFFYIHVGSKFYLKSFNIEIKNNFKYLVVISGMLFFYFIFKNLGSFQELSVFAERYRNSYYKGSGIYTFLILNVLPLIISFYLIKSKKIDRWVYYGIILSSIATFFLGLRIYLFPIIISLIIRYLSFHKNIFKIIIFSILGFLFLISFKLLLGGRIFTESSSTLDIIILTFSRTNYSALLYNGNTDIIIEFLDSSMFSLNFSKDIYDFKSFFYQSNFNNLNYYYPNIGNTSGIAIPISVIFFDSLGWFSIFLLILLLLLLINLYKKTLKSKTFLNSYIYFVLFVTVLGMLIEDVLFLSKLIINLLMFPLIYFVYEKK